MMYAYARIRGIERRAAEKLGADFDYSAGSFSLDAPAELNLARHLLRFSETVLEVERSLLPSQLCEYIFDLAGKNPRVCSPLMTLRACACSARQELCFCCRCRQIQPILRVLPSACRRDAR